MILECLNVAATLATVISAVRENRYFMAAMRVQRYCPTRETQNHSCAF